MVVHLYETGNACASVVEDGVFVYCHDKGAVEVVEQHGMAVVVAQQRLGLDVPGAVKAIAFFGICNAHSIFVVDVCREG